MYDPLGLHNGVSTDTDFPNILAGEFVSVGEVRAMNLSLYRQFRKSSGVTRRACPSNKDENKNAFDYRSAHFSIDDILFLKFQ